MNILHLNTLSLGGAFEAAYRLHKGFLENGHNSVMVVREKFLPDNTVILYRPYMKLQKVWDYALYSLTGRNPEYCFFNTCEFISFANAGSILDLVQFTPDVIMLHWVSRFLNMKTIYDMQKITKAKVVWHMLDMAPMTGGCHYAWECKGYQRHCGNCPAIYPRFPHDISSINFLLKEKYLQNINTIIIAPSNELYNQCKKSTLFKKNSLHKILLPLDIKQFTPGKKRELRQKHAIPIDGKVICFRSDDPQLKRKGFKYIIESLKILYKKNIKNIHVAIIGKISKEDKEKIPFPTTVFSSIKNSIELGDVYRLSDVLLNASIQDSGPLMINEAIACGLPVVTFPIGVSQDLVINNGTGFIARMKNSSDLADKLDRILSMNAYQHTIMSKACRELAFEKLNLKKTVKQYEKIL